MKELRYLSSYQQCVLKTPDGRYYFIYPYYKGEYDTITRTSSFDDFSCAHWKKMISLEQGRKINEQGKKVSIYPTDEYTAIGESRLIALKRQVSTYSDYGEILPFIIEDNSGVTQAEMFYMLGVCNEKLDNAAVSGYCDELVSIRYREDDESEWVTIEKQGGITSDDFDCDSGMIEFVYYIGCQCNVTYEPIPDIPSERKAIKTRIPNTGVRYEETWYFSKNTGTFRVDGVDSTFEYITIYPVTDNSSSENLDIVGKKPIYSMITYYGKEVAEVPVLYSPYYKEEELLGLQDTNSLEFDLQQGRYLSTINAHIDRGTSASFERHNILGEIKTFSDLENYRNNFFKI